MNTITNIFDKVATKRTKIRGMVAKAGKAANEYNKQMTAVQGEILDARKENTKELAKLTAFGTELTKLEEGVNLIMPVSVVDNFKK